MTRMRSLVRAQYRPLFGDRGPGENPGLFHEDCYSARGAGQDAEEGFDVRIGADVPVGVEVRAAAGIAAVAGKTAEEGLDVGVGADIAVTVEVGGAAGGGRGEGDLECGLVDTLPGVEAHGGAGAGFIADHDPPEVRAR